jgi:putative MATE family efflux protein
MGLACGLVALLGAGALLRLMSAPPEVQPLAEPFLRWLAPALMLDAMHATMVGVIRAHLRARLALAVILTMQLVHLMLAWALMLGIGPLPALGLPGFALALLASRLLGLVLQSALWIGRLGIRPRVSDFVTVHRERLAAVLRIGLPGAAENIAYRMSFMVSIAVVAGMGAQALATHAYASQAVYLAVNFGLAVGFAVEILVGHAVGAGRLHEAHRLVRRGLARGLVIAVLVAASIALAGPWVMRLFTSDPAIIAAAVTLLWWTVLVEPGRTFNLVVVNALRAAGDARYPAQVAAVSMPLVLAGGSWLLGHALGLGLVGVWIAYAADEWLRGLLMWRRWANHGWVPHARQARRRAIGKPALP